MEIFFLLTLERTLTVSVDFSSLTVQEMCYLSFTICESIKLVIVISVGQ